MVVPQKTETSMGSSRHPRPPDLRRESGHFLDSKKALAAPQESGQLSKSIALRPSERPIYLSCTF